ncbi:hypothetical protein EDD15DRAFT_824778 [Pisolithus albus]|nr:hypothetical protein EDD15DRAFT_824778 [Pisolithus albus]
MCLSKSVFMRICSFFLTSCAYITTGMSNPTLSAQQSYYEQESPLRDFLVSCQGRAGPFAPSRMHAMTVRPEWSTCNLTFSSVTASGIWVDQLTSGLFSPNDSARG